MVPSRSRAQPDLAQADEEGDPGVQGLAGVEQLLARGASSGWSEVSATGVVSAVSGMPGVGSRSPLRRLRPLVCGSKRLTDMRARSVRGPTWHGGMDRRIGRALGLRSGSHHDGVE